ncbi:MAG: hypothetical protein ACI8WB_000375 [Phenylobacterium sp.]|jgi:hypothetical protein
MKFTSIISKTATVSGIALFSLSIHAKDNPPLLPSSIPLDIQSTGSPTQKDFDELSWQTFVAINRPSTVNAQLTLWQSWQNSEDVIRVNGKPPLPWGQSSELPEACKKQAAGKLPPLVFQMVAKGGSEATRSGEVLTQTDQPFKNGPLIDQNQKFTRYEIRINQPMYDYINDNKLYSFNGQKKFKGKVEFPSSNMQKKQQGSISIKAAWKEIGNNDNAAKFYTVNGVIYIPQSKPGAGDASCETAIMGLTGLHVVHRTASAPQWVWSTFEHNDNAPDYPASNIKGHFNYYNPASDTQINQPPPQPWDPRRTDMPPTQVVRLTPIATTTKTTNQQYQQALASDPTMAVFANYELISTQWPFQPFTSGDPLGNPLPKFLANTTMETYLQGVIKDKKVELTPQGTSSCMDCHNNATIASGAAAGFSYVLQNAE